MSGPKTAFVLAGGGSLGAVQVGMLKALLAGGVTPDLIVGASETGHACALKRPPTGAIASALHGLTLLVAGQIVTELETIDKGCDFHVMPSLCPLGSSAYDFSHTKALIDRAWLAGGGRDRCDIPDVLLPNHH